MTQTTLIDLLRHGEPIGGRRYRGQRDDPLSETGWEQMWHAVSGKTPWQRIITSPLSRCRAFAEAFADKQAIPMLVDDRLQEIGFGEWEGKSAAELSQGDPDIIARYYRDPLRNRPPGAEPLDRFLTRIRAAYEEAVTRYPGSHLLLVAHAGVIRGLIAGILQTPPEATFWINVDGAHLSRIRVGGERPPTLMFHGRDRL